MPAADEMLTIDRSTGLAELGRAGAHAEERAEQVHPEQPLEAFDGFVLDLDDVVDGGVVHQHVDAPEGVDGGGEGIGHASSSVTSRCTKRGVLAEVLRDRLALVVEDVGDHDLRAFAHEQACFGLALPAGRAADDGDLAVESAHSRADASVDRRSWA